MRNRKKIYPFDENFMDKIDTHEKAYILGLLYADGCNHVNKGIVDIGLKENDEHILESIKSLFKSNINLYTYKNIKKLTFISRHLSQKLESYGMVSKKSLILEFPNSEVLPEEYLNSFVLGIFDGDGTVYKVNEKCTLGYSGSLSIMTSVKEILTKYCSVSDVKIRSYKRIHTLSFNKKEDVKNIRDFLYKDCSIFLHRKKDKLYSCDCEPYKNGNYKRKLTEKDIVEIRKLLNESLTKKTSIAKDYGISPQVLSRIKKGDSYRHF